MSLCVFMMRVYYLFNDNNNLIRIKNKPNLHQVNNELIHSLYKKQKNMSKIQNVKCLLLCEINY